MNYLTFNVKDTITCRRCKKEAERLIIKESFLDYDYYYFCEDCYQKWRKE